MVQCQIAGMTVSLTEAMKDHDLRARGCSASCHCEGGVVRTFVSEAEKAGVPRFQIYFRSRRLRFRVAPPVSAAI